MYIRLVRVSIAAGVCVCVRWHVELEEEEEKGGGGVDKNEA